MAHLRKHPGSPFWYLRSRDLDTSTWKEKTLGLLYDDPIETRRAQRIAEKTTVDEQRVRPTRTGAPFVAWVPAYLEAQWQGEGGSSRRYGIAWQWIKTFLRERQIVYPRQVRYDHGRDYIAWRKAIAIRESFSPCRFIRG